MFIHRKYGSLTSSPEQWSTTTKIVMIADPITKLSGIENTGRSDGWTLKILPNVNSYLSESALKVGFNCIA